ncbi:MAG: TPM domain-containing protein [Hyphomicrobiales bacterium]|nr:TPM domain-containing protein [Hyphomicrobiales bacterium]
MGAPKAGRALRRLAALFVLLAVTLLAGEARAQRFPELTGRVVDNARLLSAADVAQITADLAALEAKSSDQLVVATIPDLQGYPIEDFGYRLGRAWRIGQGGVNNGVLLIVAPNERKVRIEVGRGLEPQLTDAMSSLIIQNAILPAFRRGDWSGGIKAGVRDVSAVLLGDAQAVKDRLGKVQSRTPSVQWDVIIPLVFWLIVAGVIIYSHYRQSRLPPGSLGSSGRRGRGQRTIIIPGGWGGSSDWGGGRSSGGSGGGFSGGGGSFGGGGSSGSW